MIKEIAENYKQRLERIELYKKRGLDFIKSRRFILKVARPLTGKILEIGVGSGYTTLALARAGYNFTGIDTDREMIERTSLNLAHEGLASKVRFCLMDARYLSFGNSSFNNVLAVDVFHHFKKFRQVLMEMDRILEGGGKLILSDFNEAGRKIVDSVHKEEGRVHECFSTSREDICDFINSMGYKTRHYEDNCHWVLVSQEDSIRIRPEGIE